MASRQLLRWGVIGSGQMANYFAKDMTRFAAGTDVLKSVLALTREDGVSFASRYNIDKNHCYTDFDQFINSGIDVCYICTPHTSHVTTAIKCLDRNMSVLCEKPLALNEKDAASVFKKAEEKNVFMMEAVWTRFVPGMKAAMDAIKDSQIGEVVSIDVDYGFDGKNAPARLTDPALGGGSLFDIGSYGLHLATLFSNKNPHPSMPKILHTKATHLKNGVDETFNAVLAYPSHAKEFDLVLNMRLAIHEDTSCTALIHGKKGSVLLHPPFHHPHIITVNGKTVEYDRQGRGHHYQTREVFDCLQNGKIQSDIVPWNESINWAATLDALSKRTD